MSQQELSRLLQQIYPQHDDALLTEKVIEAFWPTSSPTKQNHTGEKQLKQAKQSNNANWSEADSILITYGDSLSEKKFKPLDVLKGFLDEHVRSVINSAHILPFFRIHPTMVFRLRITKKVIYPLQCGHVHPRCYNKLKPPEAHVMCGALLVMIRLI